MKNIVLFLWCFSPFLRSRFKLKISNKHIKLILVMDKKSVWKVVLNILKYGITLLLGYLGGNSESINDVVNSVL